MSNCRIYPNELNIDVYVLRLGHRPKRDHRITTHVALVARAFGARGIYLANIIDENIKKSIEKVVKQWGGTYFSIEMGIDPIDIVKSFKDKGGCIIHLTMYGLPIDNIIERVKEICRMILVIIGAGKVEKLFYELADFNIAIGNQPHSEVSALAIFLDRLWNGVELGLCFKDAKYYIIPSVRGKLVKKVE